MRNKHEVILIAFFIFISVLLITGLSSVWVYVMATNYSAYLFYFLIGLIPSWMAMIWFFKLFYVGK